MAQFTGPQIPANDDIRRPLRCRRNTYDRNTGVAIVCGREVPPGPLTAIALNSMNPINPVLCAEHRQELADWFEDLTAASRPVRSRRMETILVDLVDPDGELPGRPGELVSEYELRQILVEMGGKPAAKGPLGAEARQAAIKEKLRRIHAGN